MTPVNCLLLLITAYYSQLFPFVVIFFGLLNDSDSGILGGFSSL